MKSKILFILIFTILILFPKVNLGQGPDLGIASGFTFFTSAGTVDNDGISHITGNVGTQAGVLSGFGNVDGVMHNGDSITSQASIDLFAAYNKLNTTPSTSIHADMLGNDETLFAGVYSLAGSGSLVSKLTLDARGDSSAVFIFKVGGAFSTAVSSSINLINGALACNVFWKVEGNVFIGKLTAMRGTLISNNGTISMDAGSMLEGRMLSINGDVTIHSDTAYMPLGCGTPALAGPIAPKLAFSKCYALFSSEGSISNTGLTDVTGDVGSNTSSVTGFNPSLVTGLIHSVPDASTAHSATDVRNVYKYLNQLPYDIELLYPAQFGHGLVLTPHTYMLKGPTLFTDALILDAQGDSNAVFVIQINGNLTTSAYSKVKLINGARHKNVFWKIDGRVIINSFSDFRGNIICNKASVNLNSSVRLKGKVFTETGDINTNADTIITHVPLNCDNTILPIELISFTGECVNQNIVLTWSTATEFNNNYYTIERSTDGVNWQIITTINGAGNSSVLTNYSFIDNESYNSDSYYRLKQTDYNGNSIYFSTIFIKSCQENLTGLDVFPNPSNGVCNLIFNGDKDQVNSIEVYNLLGRKIYYSGNYQSTIDLSDVQSGIYFVQFNLDTRIITEKIAIEK